MMLPVESGMAQGQRSATLSAVWHGRILKSFIGVCSPPASFNSKLNVDFISLKHKITEITEDIISTCL